MFYTNLSTIPAALLLACAFSAAPQNCGAPQTGLLATEQPKKDLAAHIKKLGRLPAELVKAKKSDAEIANALYRESLDRGPDDTERAAITKLLGAAKDRTQKSRDILFLLVSSKEFLKLHNLDGDLPAALRLIDEATADWDKKTDAKEPDQKKSDQKKDSTNPNSCGAERTDPPTTEQPNGDLAAHMKKLGRLPAELVKAKKSDAEIVNTLFRESLDRAPVDSERAAMTKLLGGAKDRTEKSRDILFLLVNRQEFLKLHNLDGNIPEAIRLINELTADWDKKKDAKEPDQKKEGRIYFWLDQRLASVQPDGKDFKWHSKVMVNSSGLPNVSHLGNLRISPDGQRVAFFMGEVSVGDDDKTDMETKVRVLRLDKEKPIIDLGTSAHNWVWSPDGAELAYAMYEYDETQDRTHRFNWIIDVKTKKKTTLKLPAGHIIADWSADGKWFLTMASINAKEAKVKPAPNSNEVNQIYLVKRDGSEARALTDLEFSATMGRFSPDGRMILFHGRDPKKDTWHIHAMDLKERKPWKVSQELDGYVCGPCWSPDGKRIAYVYGKKSDEKGSGEPEILFRQAEHILMVADADGQNSATLRSEKNQWLRITLRAADWR
jgi:hypothetical protein